MASASSPLLNGPVSFFVLGGLQDFVRAWENDKTDDGLEILMAKWANRLYDQLTSLLSESKSHVWYLGSGIHHRHPVFGSTIWIFNRVLLSRIRDDFHKPGFDSTKQPRIVFEDLYTPERYEEWLQVSKRCPNTKKQRFWKEESKDSFTAFFEVARKLMVSQCVASNKEQLEPTPAVKTAPAKTAPKRAFPPKKPNEQGHGSRTFYHGGKTSKYHHVKSSKDSQGDKSRSDSRRDRSRDKSRRGSGDESRDDSRRDRGSRHDSHKKSQDSSRDSRDSSRKNREQRGSEKKDPRSSSNKVDKGRTTTSSKPADPSARKSESKVTKQVTLCD
jgi:hypothetical protein